MASVNNIQRIINNHSIFFKFFFCQFIILPLNSISFSFSTALVNHPKPFDSLCRQSREAPICQPSVSRSHNHLVNSSGERREFPNFPRRRKKARASRRCSANRAFLNIPLSAVNFKRFLSSLKEQTRRAALLTSAESSKSCHSETRAVICQPAKNCGKVSSVSYPNYPHRSNSVFFPAHIEREFQTFLHLRLIRLSNQTRTKPARFLKIPVAIALASRSISPPAGFFVFLSIAPNAKPPNWTQRRDRQRARKTGLFVAIWSKSFFLGNPFPNRMIPPLPVYPSPALVILPFRQFTLRFGKRFRIVKTTFRSGQRARKNERARH